MDIRRAHEAPPPLLPLLPDRGLTVLRRCAAPARGSPCRAPGAAPCAGEPVPPTRWKATVNDGGSGWGGVGGVGSPTKMGV